MRELFVENYLQTLNPEIVALRKNGGKFVSNFGNWLPSQISQSWIAVLPRRFYAAWNT